MADAGLRSQDAWVSLGLDGPGAGARGRRVDARRTRAGDRDVRRQQPGDGHGGTGPGRPSRAGGAGRLRRHRTRRLLGVTVIAQDAAALGRTAAERLFHRLDGAAEAPARVVLPTRLITRGSGEMPPTDGAAIGSHADRTLEALGLAEAPRRFPLLYAGAWPSQSGLLDGDRLLPLDRLVHHDRVPVLAVGSNACPGQLRDKMTESGITSRFRSCAPGSPAWAWVSPRTSAAWNVSASPFDATGTVRELFLTWLDAEQLGVIDASEGVPLPYGNFRRAWLPTPDVRIELEDGTRLPGVYVYVNRRGVLHGGSGAPCGHPGQRALITELLVGSARLRELWCHTRGVLRTGAGRRAAVRAGHPGVRRGEAGDGVGAGAVRVGRELSRPSAPGPAGRCRRP